MKTLQDLAYKLTEDLSVIMEEETDRAFRTASWAGRAWAPRKDVNTHPLLLKTTALRNSLHFARVANVIAVSSYLPYASIHNEGGVIRVPRTERMRRYFWARYYESKGREVKWKAMALTNKKTMNIRIPARPFVGVTDSTVQRLQQRLDQRLAGSEWAEWLRAELIKE